MLHKAAPRAKQYNGMIDLQEMDVHNLSFPDDSFDQVFTVCTFCSVPNPVHGLEQLRRVLKPGGHLRMFEHTGSRWFPFSLVLNLMTPITRLTGPEVNRPTVENVGKSRLYGAASEQPLSRRRKDHRSNEINRAQSASDGPAFEQGLQAGNHRPNQQTPTGPSITG